MQKLFVFLKMNLNRVLDIVGLALCCGWLLLFGNATSQMIFQYLNNESYYLDVLSFYLLPYAIAPFLVSSFIEGSKIKSTSTKIFIKQWINFLVLVCFTLLQLFECFVFIAAFFTTFETLEFTLELFWLLIPIILFLLFLLLVRFLFQRKHSLKLSSIS